MLSPKRREAGHFSTKKILFWCNRLLKGKRIRTSLIFCNSTAKAYPTREWVGKQISTEKQLIHHRETKQILQDGYNSPLNNNTSSLKISSTKKKETSSLQILGKKGSGLLLPFMEFRDLIRPATVARSLP